MALECTYNKNVSRKASERERKMECEKSKGKFRKKLTTERGRGKKALISTHLQDLSLLIETK